MTRKEQILSLRSQGMKYRQIAAEVGVSFQYVAVVCGKSDRTKFRPMTETDCVYPALRSWINEHGCSRNELVRRLGLQVCGETNARIGKLLRGDSMPAKPMIDRLIATTGLPYETLFAAETVSEVPR